MEINKELRWLVQVRQHLLSLNYLAYKDRKPYRQYLFKKPLKLDHKAWLTYYHDKYTAIAAVREDLELPIIEQQKPKILIY